jgi:hypothetical protein
VGLKAGPWFPHLHLDKGARLSDHCVRRLKPTKSAGMKRKAPAAAQADQAEGAVAGVGTDSSSTTPCPSTAQGCWSE